MTPLRKEHWMGRGRREPSGVLYCVPHIDQCSTYWSRWWLHKNRYVKRLSSCIKYSCPLCTFSISDFNKKRTKTIKISKSISLYRSPGLWGSSQDGGLWYYPQAKCWFVSWLRPEKTFCVGLGMVQLRAYPLESQPSASAALCTFWPQSKLPGLQRFAAKAGAQLIHSWALVLTLCCVLF